jgi:hypothetical protein
MYFLLAKFFLFSVLLKLSRKNVMSKKVHSRKQTTYAFRGTVNVDVVVAETAGTYAGPISCTVLTLACSHFEFNCLAHV